MTCVFYEPHRSNFLPLSHVIKFASYDLECEMRGVQKWKADMPGPVKRMSAVELLPNSITIDSFSSKWQGIRPKDESEFFCLVDSVHNFICICQEVFFIDSGTERQNYHTMPLPRWTLVANHNKTSLLETYWQQSHFWHAFKICFLHYIYFSFLSYINVEFCFRFRRRALRMLIRIESTETCLLELQDLKFKFLTQLSINVCCFYMTWKVLRVKEVFQDFMH